MQTYTDYSYLFSNSSSSSGIFSINIGDYNSIRSGSYGKLLKAYYASESDSSTRTSSTKKTTTKSDVDSTGLSKMKAESDELKSAAEELTDSSLWKASNGSYDVDKIAKAVKSFVDEYNDVIAQSSKVSNSDVSQYVSWMKNMTTTLSGSLSKAGITAGTDGKLTLNEDTLKAADSKTLKSLFSGSTSYAGQIKDEAASISSAALRTNSLYSSTGSILSSLQSTYSTSI